MKNYQVDNQSYVAAMGTSHEQNAILRPFYVNTETELKEMSRDIIADIMHGDSNKGKDIKGTLASNPEYKWDGPGNYDIYHYENGRLVVRSTFGILEKEFSDIVDTDELFNPKLIEKRFGGKVYGIFRKNNDNPPSNCCLDYIIINTKKENPKISKIIDSFGLDIDSSIYRNRDSDLEYFVARVTELNFLDLVEFLTTEIECSDSLEILEY